MPDEQQLMLAISDIASIFSVNEETVRRWIKTGKLKAVMDSKKEGYKVAEEDLRNFIEIQKPKYRKLLPFLGVFLSPMATISPLLGALASIPYGAFTDFVMQNYTKRKDIPASPQEESRDS